jgi:hypothetical protein
MAIQIRFCETHGQQGWHDLLSLSCTECATMVARMLLLSGRVIQSAAQFMPPADASMDHVIRHLNLLFNTTIKVSEREAFLRTVRQWLAAHTEFMAPTLVPAAVPEDAQPVPTGYVRLLCGCLKPGQALHCGFSGMCLDHCPCHKNFITDSAPAGVPGAE